MRNVADKSCSENQDTHSMFNNSETHIVYEVTWKNIVQPGRSQMTKRSIGITCRIPNATTTLFFHCNNGCKNVTQCYIICTLPVLFIFLWESFYYWGNQNKKNQTTGYAGFGMW